MLLMSSIETFKVDTVLVLGHERLYNDLKQFYSDTNVCIIKIEKSGGVLY